MKRGREAVKSPGFCGSRKGERARRACLWGLLPWVLSATLFPGCGVYTTYQSARVLPPGHVAPGLECGFGAAPSDFGWLPVMVDLGPAVRIGVAKDVDVGVRPTLLYADVKYQFLRGGLDGALDFGFSYWPPTSVGFDYSHKYQEFGLYPMVLFSTAHYFYGARIAYLRQSEDNRVSNFLLPGGVVGLSIGRRFRFIPTIGLYLAAPNPGLKTFAFGLGFGLEYELGRQR